uniref:Tetratricopeptide repeat protein n=1 Tax=Panagrolaimus sp. JU765 TaxID=591449 RepID=A0AC34QH11_9BILA
MHSPEPSSSLALVRYSDKKPKIKLGLSKEMYDKLIVHHLSSRLNYKSAKLAEGFAKKVMFLEKNMWELSTLGGAYAAMCPYAESFKNLLMNVSKSQYKVASELGNDLYKSRSRIYIANALAYNGDFDKALEIIEREVRYNSKILTDRCTATMAIAMRDKIKKMKKLSDCK